MRIIGIAVLVLGLTLAGGAVYVVSDYYGRYQATLASQMPRPPETVKILAAKKPLNYGDQIGWSTSGDMLQWVVWPKEAVPAGAFTRGEDLVGEDLQQTRTVLRAIEPGEPLLKTKLTGFGESIRVATRVSEGMRAVTIPIDAVSGVAGLIAPGDRVDMLLTRSVDSELTTSIILQNVLVIATDQSAGSETARNRVARTATIEVGPTDASKLALAQQVGKLSLSLRGVNEALSSAVEPVRIEDLPAQPEFILPEIVAAPAPVVRIPTVRVRKGAEVTDVQVR